jgi:hypothetical protein
MITVGICAHASYKKSENMKALSYPTDTHDLQEE